MMPVVTASQAQAGNNMTKGKLLNVFNMEGTKGGGVVNEAPPSSCPRSLMQQTQMIELIMYQIAKPAPTMVKAVRSWPKEKACLQASRQVQ